MVTLSNVAVAPDAVLWLDTPSPATKLSVFGAALALDPASPTRIVAFIGTVSTSTTVQVTPSADCDPVIRLPLRSRRTQYGAGTVPPGVLTVAPASAPRRWNASPLLYDTS